MQGFEKDFHPKRDMRKLNNDTSTMSIDYSVMQHQAYLNIGLYLEILFLRVIDKKLYCDETALIVSHVWYFFKKRKQTK